MNWINYLLQVNLYLILTFGFYWVLLRKETFYNANRAYLMAASIISFTIPFWQSGIIQSWGLTEQVSTAVATINLEEFTVSNFQERPTWSWNLLAISIYFIGFGFGLLRFSIGLFKLQQLFSIKNLDGQAFSVFGKVFIDKNLADYQTIKTHEEVHSKAFHSMDVFWFELLGVVCWFNPFAHFMQKEIKVIHEYIADDIAAAHLGSKKDYATVLVSSHFRTNSNVLVNNFYNKSILKTRIMMLSKEKSKKNAQLKYGLIAPLFIGMLIVAAACTEQAKELSPSGNITAEMATKAKLQALEGEIFIAVESNPEFPGGISEMYSFINENISFTQEARDANISGRVFVKFVVDKDGNVRDYLVLKGLGHGLEEETFRVLDLMPKWKPGLKDGKPVNVYFTMPFFFQLEDEDGIPKALKPETNDREPPLVIVDGRELSQSEAETFYKNTNDKTDIESITVLRDEDSNAKYGEKGKNGVVEIIMK